MRRVFAIAVCCCAAPGLSLLLGWDAGPPRCKHAECSGQTWRGNTHLWVVDRALDLLAKSDDPIAKQVVMRMRKPGARACRTQSESGLWDTDDGYLAENFGWRQRLGTHFYNPTGLDAHGDPTGVTTYTLLGTEKKQFGDGRLNARYRVAAMLRRPGDNLPDSNGNINGEQPKMPPEGGKPLTDRELLKMSFIAYYPGSFYFDSQNGDDRCYDLGIALHYLTDVTEPFHASGYDVFKIPTMLHAVYEDYVPHIQEKFPVGATVWSKLYISQENGITPDADQVFDKVARASNALAKPLLDTILAVGNPYEPITPEFGTTCTCPKFPGNAEVDKETGVVLATAYQSVASYLYAAFRDEYQDSRLARRCPAGTQFASDKKCYQECRPGYTTYGLRCVDPARKMPIYRRESTPAKT
jgi:hypothetical protein